MSENEGDWGEMDLDAEQRAEAEVNLEQPSAMDDEPWSPPDERPHGAELLTDDTGDGETIEDRIAQEEPELGTAYGAPDPRGEAEEMREELVGGDDPDAIPADREVLGGRAGEDVPLDYGAPEEQAMRVIEGEELP